MRLYTNFFVDVLRSHDPSHILLTEDEQNITAGDLLSSACKIAAGLSRSGVKEGHKVIIAVKPGIEFLQVMYANMMLGTISAIIDPEMGRENYLAKLRQFAPDHAFVDSKLVFLNEHPLLKMILLRLNAGIPSFPRIRHCSLFTSGMRLPVFQKHKKLSSFLNATAHDFEFQHIPVETEFLVTYTSGTLSEPKGVVHTYRSLANSIRQLSSMLQQNRDATIATHLPHFALLGINAGVKVILWNPKMSAARKIAFISDNQVTTLFGPPSDFIPMTEHALKHNLNLPATLKNIYLGSAPVYPSFLSVLIPLSPGIKITCLYGMTENLMVARQDGREKHSALADGDLVGLPFENVTLSIAPDGEIGLTSDQLFARYWNAEKSGEIHMTGDIGKLDAEGRLLLLGRKKDMIIRGNFNIYPGLYESTISRIKGVKEAVMIGIYNSEKSDEEIILVIDGDKQLSETGIIKELKNGKHSIDKQALPDRVVFMKIPHSGRQQKTDKKALRTILNSAG